MLKPLCVYVSLKVFHIKNYSASSFSWLIKCRSHVDMFILSLIFLYLLHLFYFVIFASHLLYLGIRGVAHPNFKDIMNKYGSRSLGQQLRACSRVLHMKTKKNKKKNKITITKGGGGRWRRVHLSRLHLAIFKKPNTYNQQKKDAI